MCQGYIKINLTLANKLPECKASPLTKYYLPKQSTTEIPTRKHHIKKKKVMKTGCQ